MSQPDYSVDLQLSPGAQLKLQATGAVPPVQSYVAQNAVMQIQVWNALAGQTVNVGAQILLPDGTISLNEWDILPGATRGRQLFTFSLAEGFLISFTVVVSGGLAGNRTFVAVRLLSSQGGGRVTTQVLCQGYLSGQKSLAWPPGIYQDAADGPGAIVSVTGTLPAAGVDISEVVPTSAIWRLKTFYFKLTTSATVANRIAHLIVDDGTNVLLDLPVGTAQTASQTIAYVVGDGAAASNVVDGVQQFRFPFDIRLMPGYRIRTLTTALAAGDQFTAPQYLVTEWLFS
jgi:hypothetical protein